MTDHACSIRIAAVALVFAVLACGLPQPAAPTAAPTISPEPTQVDCNRTDHLDVQQKVVGFSIAPDGAKVCTYSITVRNSMQDDTIKPVLTMLVAGPGSDEVSQSVPLEAIGPGEQTYTEASHTWKADNSYLGGARPQSISGVLSGGSCDILAASPDYLTSIAVDLGPDPCSGIDPAHPPSASEGGGL